jgi:hypothetical protein
LKRRKSMATVIVHRFTVYDIVEDVTRVAKGWATAEKIAEYGGAIVPNSQREVEISDLNHNGRYYEPGSPRV